MSICYFLFGVILDINWFKIMFINFFFRLLEKFIDKEDNLIEFRKIFRVRF